MTENIMNDVVINTLADSNDMFAKMRFLNAYNNAYSLKDYMNTTLYVCDVFVTNGIRRGYGGAEDTPCYNVYLIATDGACYFTQSSGVARSVFMINETLPDWGKSGSDGCVKVRCVEKVTTGGNRMKSLEIMY